ncbi:winged helix-turn-helix transcriptional regulator [Chitinophaga sp. 22321]|uniref:Helix-turn-helix transcriptional regulator n=1 Tax=Chitinophaga hostae TaxID=2831022 RepID=A0ABS5J0M7_9BACT|nr:helix-turn-helix domain-containing protein [Chitinophaga hostae]MBS0028112.1 helix-turn-helix transcriptional regulator [Chitinophaga hostae]
MRKEQSTNYENRQKIIAACPISYTLSLIEGRWKPMILHQLFSGISRYSEIKKAISIITERMLTAELKELELRGMIHRKSHEEAMLKVEYGLTERGESLRPVFQQLWQWGKSDRTTSAAFTKS